VASSMLFAFAIAYICLVTNANAEVSSGFTGLGVPDRAQVVNMLTEMDKYSLSTFESVDKEGKEAEFLAKWVDSLRLIEKYFDNRRKLCSGDAEQQKKYCREDLKNLQVHFVDSTYNVHKNFLEFSHKRRLDELEKNKARLLDFIKKSDGKKFKSPFFDNALRGK
ncbi:MAG: hypothetical protein HQK53_04840, partial [Oligoflexia bacterium]|nr:hypothetical protein [Oligoflexia bacterium]